MPQDPAQERVQRRPDRLGLTDRLGALLSDSSLTRSQNSTPKSSPKSSSEYSLPSSLDSPSNMRRAALPPLSSARSSLHHPTSLPSTSTSTSTTPPPHSTSPTPVLRWLTSLTSQLADPLQTNHARSYSLPSSPSRSTDSLPAPPRPADLALLTEALNEPLIPQHPHIHDEDLPSRPPLACLPASFRPSRNLSRPPPFFNNLTRSTLPTSSLFPPVPISLSPYSRPPSPSTSTYIQPPPIVLTHSPPTSSSIDTLRTVSARSHTRSFATASTIATPDDTLNIVSPFSRWFQFDTKEPLLSEEDQEQPKSQVKKKYKSPHNPVVFCHGLLGFDSVTIGPAIAPLEVTHWRGIKEVLEENGTEVLITRVPATSSPVDRAIVLEEKISQVYPGKSVHLIGHSMGGLDCRYLTTHLKNRKFNVLSVTTIATPHRGSSFADHFLSTVGRTRMPSVLSILDMLPNGGGDGKAFECLTLESMKKFNEETPDVEGVRYFSWGAVYEPGLIDTWKWPHSVILEKEGPNDGLVSVESAKWGTYLGTLSQVNHLDLVGWVNAARYKWAEMMGKEIKFRPATFYLGIVDMLARQVEGQADDEHEGASVEQSHAGAGVELEGERNIHANSTEQPSEDREREQMVQSLDAAGADVKTVDGADEARESSRGGSLKGIPKET